MPPVMTPTSSSGTQSSRFHTIDIRNAHEFENRSLETKNGARFVQDRGPVYLQMSKSDATRLPVELIDLISEFVAHTDIPAMSLTCKPWAKALARTHLHQKVRVTELAPALLADQGARVRACHYARLISADLGKAPPLSRLQIARQGHCRELREALANTSLIEHENKRTSLGSLLMERHRLEE